jgi:hypothetical protein
VIIEFEPSAIEYFFPTDEERTLLSKDETQFLESLNKIVSESQKDIKAIAVYDLTMGSYVGRVKGAAGIKNAIHVVGYKGAEERVTSFRVIGTVLRTDDGHEFRYDRGLPHLQLLMAQVWPLALRVGCEMNLAQLFDVLSEMGDAAEFPSSAQWCDDILRHSVRLNSADPYASTFQCPSAQICHYAMNPHCKRDSPAETVLLFETKPSWNQHGGPELFTVDNHDPKGGLVLLNDGTVKFIRTEEELKQLRWK